jgi:hypothetical protein
MVSLGEKAMKRQLVRLGLGLVASAFGSHRLSRIM